METYSTLIKLQSKLNNMSILIESVCVVIHCAYSIKQSVSGHKQNIHICMVNGCAILHLC